MSRLLDQSALGDDRKHGGFQYLLKLDDVCEHFGKFIACRRPDVLIVSRFIFAEPHCHRGAVLASRESHNVFHAEFLSIELAGQASSLPAMFSLEVAQGAVVEQWGRVSVVVAVDRVYSAAEFLGERAQAQSEGLAAGVDGSRGRVGHVRGPFEAAPGSAAGLGVSGAQGVGAFFADRVDEFVCAAGGGVALALDRVGGAAGALVSLGREGGGVVDQLLPILAGQFSGGLAHVAVDQLLQEGRAVEGGGFHGVSPSLCILYVTNQGRGQLKSTGFGKKEPVQGAVSAGTRHGRRKLFVRNGKQACNLSNFGNLAALGRLLDRFLAERGDV